MCPFSGVLFALLPFLVISFTTDAYELATDSNYSLSMTDCYDANDKPSFLSSLCCQTFVESEAIMRSCVKKHKKILLYTSNKETQLLRLSILIECYWNGKGYIENINAPPKVTLVKTNKVFDDAKKKYGNNSYAIKFTTVMYQECTSEVISSITKIQMNPRAYAFFETLHNPRYFLLFSCITNYSSRSCPYFHWTGKNRHDTQICRILAKQCPHFFTDY